MITTKDMMRLMDEMLSVANAADMSQAMPEATYNLITLNAIRDFIAAHSWQDISTAPTNGDAIIIARIEDGVFTFIQHAFSDGRGGWFLPSDSLRDGKGTPLMTTEDDDYPTHWMQIPPQKEPTNDQSF